MPVFKRRQPDNVSLATGKSGATGFRRPCLLYSHGVGFVEAQDLAAGLRLIFRFWIDDLLPVHLDAALFDQVAASLCDFFSAKYLPVKHRTRPMTDDSSSFRW